MLGGMTVMTNPHHTAKGVVLGAKEIGGLTWAALAFVLGVPVATLTNWIRREDKEARRRLVHGDRRRARGVERRASPPDPHGQATPPGRAQRALSRARGGHRLAPRAPTAYRAKGSAISPALFWRASL
jgi:hypothetical protein